MNSLSIVSEFSGLNMKEVLELPHDTFLLIQRNYVIKSLNSTQNGKEMLKLWEIYNTTAPDYDKIRRNNFYNKG